MGDSSRKGQLAIAIKEMLSNINLHIRVKMVGSTLITATLKAALLLPT